MVSAITALGSGAWNNLKGGAMLPKVLVLVLALVLAVSLPPTVLAADCEVIIVQRGNNGTIELDSPSDCLVVESPRGRLFEQSQGPDKVLFKFRRHGKVRGTLTVVNTKANKDLEINELSPRQTEVSVR